MIEKQFLEECLKKGLSTRKIEKLLNYSLKRSTISYYIKKYNLTDMMNYKKPKYVDEYFFNKIDTKEKAYILGYTLADGYIANNVLMYGCALEDKEILLFIQKQIGGAVREYNVINKKLKRFPNAKMNIANKQILLDINKFGNKENKTFPRIQKDLERYMLLGFFDGDGCITWGRRKDRNRIWQKVCFTGSFKLLSAIQKLLIKLEISSTLHPKGKENCYVLELSSKKDVYKIMEYLYGNRDLIVLHRKYNKYNALRLEWGEFEGTMKYTTSSQAEDHSSEGVETTGEKLGSLNNQLERLSLK